MFLAGTVCLGLQRKSPARAAAFCGFGYRNYLFVIENNIPRHRKRGEEMIIGVGIDIIEMDRVKRAVERRKGFVDRLFSREEADHFARRGMAVSSIAGGVAAKEAVAKAMGTGFTGFGWKDVVILRDPLGKPEVKLRGGARRLCEAKGIERILVSISHGRDYAVAQAIAIGGERHEGRNP
jgi:holo-[acyl-carrier protein] synthase